MAIKNLQKAKENKKDEFYTQYEDIEKELVNYKDQFKDKIVYCNCDDPKWSNFTKFFLNNFKFFGLKKLICTHFETNKPSYKLVAVRDENSDGVVDENDMILTPLKQNKNQQMTIFDLMNDEVAKEFSGDFRSPECIELLKEADIVVTNPPFSLFREYVSQLVEYDKKFIIIGSKNAITYKEIFKLIKENKIWLGYGFNNGNAFFAVPQESANDYAEGVYNKQTGLVKFRNCGWFTNLDTKKRHDLLPMLSKIQNERNGVIYADYENYNAINVDKTIHIPFDYNGEIGVPITFLDKWNPEQFEIIGLGIVGSLNFTSERKMEILKDGQPTGKYTVNAKGTLYRKFNKEIDKFPAFKDCENEELYSSIYARIIIKHKLKYDEYGNVLKGNN